MGALDEAGHSGPPSMVRHTKGKNHSGLQKQVFSLYRSYLRVAYEKQRLGEEGTVAFVRDRFRSEAHSIDRMNFHMIEYLLRKGERQVKQFKAAKNATYVQPAQQ
ncbi:hypothetical protein SDRG_04227 [Saprolegnia diclina VS20]|uniref:Complex 1 LYR protein domain-containing protein n=1 Tax=Saprolegnia diclina (strain VS20) TaxID=1156394 RepID=T0QWY4_SAPDV|nr:hypothetical protein SDRG_04227 [Saprolegnia diclina VS20]EQC38520.1 hypothetical protein SDRG_04227 [Saprolegnia diclina VS20]|eukprot:XP_008608112.1 hypothetical protein SDRG_04227 [Saprolegnia diclina VS20]